MTPLYMDHLRATLRRYLADEPYRRLADDELWTRFRDHREEGAFRVLLEKTGGRIYARCRAILRVEADAEEAFQEAYGALFKHRAKLPTYRAAVAWLYQTATNKARMQRRWQWRSLLRDRRKVIASPASTEAGDDLAQREQREAVAAALAALPERERRAVELVYLEGMTQAEAADALGWSRGALGKYVQRGLERLRRAPGLREGTTVAVLTAALAEVPALPPERLAALSECLWTRAGTVAESAGGWWLAGRPRLVAGLTACAGVATVGGLALWPRPAAGPQSPTAQVVVAPAAEPESLPAKNLRILHADVIPKLLAELRTLTPPDNPMTVADARAFGSEVAVEFATARPSTTFMPNRLRLRYCTLRRSLSGFVNPPGDDRWYTLDPEHPIELRNFPLPFGGRTTVRAGRGLSTTFARIFDALPPDVRAESEFLGHLFGRSERELVLPAGLRGASGFAGGLILATGDGALLVRDELHRWQCVGACPGWNPVVADGRVYCSGHGVIRSRPLADPTAAWDHWCDEPPVGTGEKCHALFTAGGRLYATVNPHMHYSRPLADPAAGWVRHESPLWPDGLAATGDTLFGNDRRRLYARPAADPAAAWVPVGPWPGECSVLVADGDRLLAFGLKTGPIHARPAAAGPDVPWEVAGRVHDPAER